MRPTYAAKLDRSRAPRPAPAQGASIPPPIEGWDTVSPVQAMSPKRAVRLENWFPQQSWVELRKGSVRHAALPVSDPVESLMSYQGPVDAILFAAAGTAIYDCDAPGSASLSGLTNARWQHANFAGTVGPVLYIVNGADDPHWFDGTSWTAAVITGSGISPADFITVTPHKGRLWFSIANSSDAAYLAADAVQGTATRFPLGGNWSLGGHLVQIASWSLDGGNGPDDYIAFVSSRGQVSIYSGTNPATDFALVGTYYIGTPIGRRCVEKVGADVAIVSIDGVVPLSKALIFERAAITKVTMTALIQRVLNQAARDYKDNFGWQLISYPRGTRVILNVPQAEAQRQEQYVMNTLSGAWCRFTGMEAGCWELHNDDLFFGGNAGIVFQADVGSTDNGVVVEYDMMTAFNYFKSLGQQKRWTMCRPLLTTDQQVQPGIAFNVDFQEDAPIQVPTSSVQSGALWDVALWDNSLWAGAVVTQSNWLSVTGIGYCASVRMKVDVGNADAARWGFARWGFDVWSAADSGAVTLQVNGFDLIYEKGAFI